MRLSMMPTAKKKLGGIGLFTRQADGPVSGPVASSNPLISPNPRPSTVGLPLPSTPAVPPSQFHQRELQPPPEIVTARQERDSLVPAALAVRALPVPKVGRLSSPFPSANPPGSLPPNTNQLHLHPMHRTRTSASETGPRDRDRDRERDTARAAHTHTGNAWEDSTVASMFGDSEGRPASDRFRAHSANPATAAAHLRQYSDTGNQRTVRVSPTKATRIRAPQHQHPDIDVPFTYGENGMLKVVAQPASQNRLASVTSGVLHDPPLARVENIYPQPEYAPFDSTPTKLIPPRRINAAPKETRELPRGSFAANGFSDTNSISMSPERREPQERQFSPERLPTETLQPTSRNTMEDRRLNDRVIERQQREREQAKVEEQREQQRERVREQPRELHHKRSTVFEHAEPAAVEDPTFNNTRAAVVGPISNSTSSSPKSVTEAAQRTPRQPPQQPLPVLPAHAGYPPTNPPPMGPLENNSLARTGNRRFKAPTAASKESRKRRLSPDYNDADLHRMSYADLRQQDFDYDPQNAAVQQPQQPTAPLLLNPAGASLEDRLEFYQKQGGMDQHTFFTRMPMREWDEAGDWFLSRFGDVVNRMKEARKNKRKLVEAFETEISTREEAVRVKMEGIAKTLEDFKAEGRSMMEGKEMDLEG
ncbi:extracellular mutant protein 11-domain-containing protein [Podospora conica]|nr:extracellular mutant protein 11-domain-containing protein [Schizothecium conicum]